jgi:hypothetical protein
MPPMTPNVDTGGRYLPPCIDQPNHEVALGTHFCTQCGLVIGRKRTRKRNLTPIPQPRRFLPTRRPASSEVARLVRRYGYEAVEDALFDIYDKIAPSPNDSSVS